MDSCYARLVQFYGILAINSILTVRVVPLYIKHKISSRSLAGRAHRHNTRTAHSYDLRRAHSRAQLIPVILVVRTLKAHGKTMNSTQHQTSSKEVSGGVKEARSLNKKRKVKKQKGGMDEASRKMAKFAFIVGLLELAAFVVRIRKPHPRPTT